MKPNRRFVALVVGAFILLAGSALAIALPYSLEWDHDYDEPECNKLGESPERTEDGWIHWILNQAKDVDGALLELGGSGSGSYEPAKYGSVIEFFTPYFDVETLTATLYYSGALGRNSQFVISDYCPGVIEQSLEVTKTAIARFSRTHAWDIDKSVDTENGHELDGFPKIWLDGPGSEGDETATWTVEVTYLGYTDHHFTVFGVIEIENVSASMRTKTVTSIVDDLGFTGYADIELDCQDGASASFDPALDLPKDIDYAEVWICYYDVDLTDEGAVPGVFGTNEVSVEVENDLNSPYLDTADWMFGDEPYAEQFETVDIEDISDLFGEVALGTVTAPTGATFPYSKDFAWEDFDDECGEHLEFDDTATIVQTGQSSSARLLVNVRCEELTVRKTAVTTYQREHFWDIDKRVETEFDHEHEGYPKVWLYTDGSGDETATWTVDVTYEGSEDGGWNVAGAITIVNTGTLPAVITAVDDRLAAMPIDVDCGVAFPTTLAIGETLTCSYDEDGYVEGSNAVTVTTERDQYSACAAIVWGDPTTVIDETVHVEDLSDLFGDVDLGSVTAPNGDSFTYGEDFAWADYGAGECGDFVYRNTASIVETGQSASALLKVNVQCFVYESAWAKGDDAESFCDNGFSNWGWTNPILPGTYDWDLWAGAGQCETANGTLVGSVTVVYDGDGYVDVTFHVDPAYDLEETHVYAGYEMFPPGGTAPGLYYNDSPFDGSQVYVIAHAVVGMPDPTFGP